MRINRPNVSSYVAAICVVAVGMFAFVNWSIIEATPALRSALASLLGLALLAEVFSTRLSVTNATTAVSFVPYIASMVLLGPAWAIVVAAITEFVAETVIRRKEWLKVAHNTAKEIIAVGTAGSLYVLLGGAPGVEVFKVSAPAFAVAVTVYFVISNGAAATAIALSSGMSLNESWGRWVGRTILFDLFASSLALLLAFLYVELQFFGLLLVIIPLFFVRHSNHVNRQLEETNRDLLDLMVKAIEARDPYTSGHSQRVAKLAGILAREIGLGFREVESITTAALLHDVGKIFEDFAPLLRKAAKLTSDERRTMETHPIRSAELVNTISNLRGDVERCVRHHHENFDGSGYPEGISGEQIPLGSRIIMIADTTDAMITDRPYRSALSFDQVGRELELYSGRQFDPRLVAAFRASTTIHTTVAPRAGSVPPSVEHKPARWRMRAVR